MGRCGGAGFELATLRASQLHVYCRSRLTRPTPPPHGALRCSARAVHRAVQYSAREVLPSSGRAALTILPCDAARAVLRAVQNSAREVLPHSGRGSALTMCFDGYVA